MKKFNEIEQTPETAAQLLEMVRIVRGLKNDAQLSRVLGVAPPVISKIRMGVLKVGASMVVRILEETDFSINQIKAILQGE